MRLMQTIRRRNPGASIARILWWDLIRLFLHVLLYCFYRIRSWGAKNIPAAGPVLLICNHQSFLDLMSIGVSIPHRHFHSMARRTLFNHPLFGWLIRSLNAFAVDQEKPDVGAMRTAIRRLNEGQMVLVFPEGGRSREGVQHPFQKGILVLIRRARPVVVPMALEGNYDIWPHHRKLPRLRGRTATKIGQPIDPDKLLSMTHEQAMRYLEASVEKLRLELRQTMREQSRGRYPAYGDADEPAVPLDVLDAS